MIKRVFSVVVFIVLFEFLSFLVVRFLKLAQPPESYKCDHLPFFIDRNKDFGVWHYDNAETRHYAACWNVKYRFNSYGARDKERARQAKSKRIIFIGDSFVEGYGIEEEERLSNVIERKTGIECLNFGTSGSFGTTQMRLLYQTLGKQYKHDLLVVSFFPFNDFGDDAYELCKDFIYTKNRYRPYLIPDTSHTEPYKLIYHVPRLEDSEFYIGKYKQSTRYEMLRSIYHQKDLNIFQKAVKLYTSFFYSGAIFKHITQRISSMGKDEHFKSEVFSNPDQASIDLFFYNLKKINEIADVPIILLTIAHPLDMVELRGKQPKLLQKVKVFCEKEGIELLDLASAFSEKNDHRLYLPCDGHWSPKGNKLAAELFLDRMEQMGIK